MIAVSKKYSSLWHSSGTYQSSLLLTFNVSRLHIPVLQQPCKTMFGWIPDPLLCSNADGEVTRPITFAHNGDFQNSDTMISSIDGILLNHIAVNALQSMQVIYTDGRQHASIQAKFQWQRLKQKGFVLVKPAPLCFENFDSNDAKLEKIARDEWNEKFANAFQSSDDSTWQAINDCAVFTLKRAGAKFLDGPQNRGRAPSFKEKSITPGHSWSKCALTMYSAKLAKLFKMTGELRRRIQRAPNGLNDASNTNRLVSKLSNLLKELKVCTWSRAFFLQDDHVLVRIQNEIHTLIQKVQEKEKTKRISAWKHRMRFALQKAPKKDVYSWLKRKVLVPSPNLVKDGEGNIIFCPITAIKEMNSKWGDIFACNVLHDDPERILHFIWPYIQDISNPVQLPTLTGADLKTQVMKRRNDAAPGLDGWRTYEVKMLPTYIFDLVASFFQEVETNKRNLPQTLLICKQVALPKEGKDEPLNKRLITLLPIFLLAYTGLRFYQLQQWQATTMPPELYGGIKNRKMSQVQAAVRLHIDHAKTTKCDIVGMKLDKSKCFDRIIPKVAAAILIGLGVPSNVITVYIRMYDGLKKHLAYKQWISPKATTSANGTIQGCSFSLLAVNALMCGWARLVQRIPNIYMASFIDDSYMWCKAENQQMLAAALQVTSLWDQLTGQVLNKAKSEIWATGPAARRNAKQLFPELAHVTTVVVLGARIQTAEKLVYNWDKAKTEKIRREIRLIRALPVSRETFTLLFSTKIIPQLTFASLLNCIPKCALKSIQSDVADCLWKDRPLWRSRFLLLGLLSKPHRVEPFIAKAFNAICECVTFLKHCKPEFRSLWEQQAEANHVSRNSSFLHFLQALEVFGLELTTAFDLSICDLKLNILDLSVRDFKRLLVQLARSMCYQKASGVNRKDFHK